jgi:hypothetical protein
MLESAHSDSCHTGGYGYKLKFGATAEGAVGNNGHAVGNDDCSLALVERVELLNGCERRVYHGNTIDQSNYGRT